MAKKKTAQKESVICRERGQGRVSLENIPFCFKYRDLTSMAERVRVTVVVQPPDGCRPSICGGEVDVHNGHASWPDEEPLHGVIHVAFEAVTKQGLPVGPCRSFESLPNRGGYIREASGYSIRLPGESALESWLDYVTTEPITAPTPHSWKTDLYIGSLDVPMSRFYYYDRTRTVSRVKMTAFSQPPNQARSRIRRTKLLDVNYEADFGSGVSYAVELRFLPIASGANLGQQAITPPGSYIDTADCETEEPDLNRFYSVVRA